MGGVGSVIHQDRERDRLFLDEVARVDHVTGTYGDHFGAPIHDLLIAAAQLRGVLAAKQSAEVPEEDEDHRAVRPEITQPVDLAVRSGQLNPFEAFEVHQRSLFSPAVPRNRIFIAPAVLSAAALFLAGCSSSSSSGAASSTTTAGGSGAASSTTAASPSGGQTAAGATPVHHVFIIMLENEASAATFGSPQDDPYLATTLTGQGEFLQNYYGVGHNSLDNYVAIMSGQPPNPSTQADCANGFKDFPASGAPAPWAGATGIEPGSGCIYPASVKTLADQLTAKGLTWKAYMEDMGNNPTRDNAPTSVCGHPVPNTDDQTEAAANGDGYASRHDPFVYFHSIIDNPAQCSKIVPLGTTSGAMPTSDTVGATGLATDLRSVATTPNLSWITPDLCDDGHDYPCTNETAPGANRVADIDSFLKQWVPLITGSAAFKKDGLLMITFDEAEFGEDSTACCNEMAGPASTTPGINGAGGGKTGTILISPFVKAGSINTTSFNHYSTLASLEDYFGVPRLGDAQTAASTFGTGIFTGSKS